jgi:hypothetical protein
MRSHNGVRTEFQLGDLRVVSDVNGRAVSRNRAVQILLVDGLVGVKNEALFAAGNGAFHLGKFTGHKPDQRQL